MCLRHSSPGSDPVAARWSQRAPEGQDGWSQEGCQLAHTDQALSTLRCSLLGNYAVLQVRGWEWGQQGCTGAPWDCTLTICCTPRSCQTFPGPLPAPWSFTRWSTPARPSCCSASSPSSSLTSCTTGMHLHVSASAHVCICVSASSRSGLPHLPSSIHISRKSWHTLLNTCFHIAMTTAVYTGGITLTSYPVVCQAVSLSPCS